jgi:hypothetical protein
MKSDNKIKTFWSMMKRITGTIPSNDELASSNINKTEMRDSLTIINAFNNYFLTVAGNISSNNENNDILIVHKKTFPWQF